MQLEGISIWYLCPFQVGILLGCHQDFFPIEWDPRLFSRAFIFEEGDNNAIVYVLVDTCMVGQLVKKRVIRALRRMYGDRGEIQYVVYSGLPLS